MDLLGRNRPRGVSLRHDRRGGDRRRPYRRRRFHRTRPLPDRIDRRAGAHLRAGADRRRMVARSHPLGLRSEAHARSDRQCRDDLLPARSRRGRLAAGTGDRHLRHDGRRTVSFGGDVPLADADRRGAPRGLRRASRSRLRQEFADGTLQGGAERRGRIPDGQSRSSDTGGVGKRPSFSGQLGGGTEDRLLPRPALQPRTGGTLRCGPHRAQHLLLHGRILGLRRRGRSEGGLLGRRLGARRAAGRREHAAEFRRQFSPHDARLRRRGVPQTDRRPLRPDHPRPARLRQAPQGAGQRHAGVQAPQRTGVVADPAGRHPFHLLLLAGRDEGAVPHDGLLGGSHRRPQRAHPAPARAAGRPPDQHLSPRRGVSQRVGALCGINPPTANGSMP